MDEILSQARSNREKYTDAPSSIEMKMVYTLPQSELPDFKYIVIKKVLAGAVSPDDALYEYKRQFCIGVSISN